jgi:hypothetical protein
MAHVTKPRAVLEYELSLVYHKSPIAVERHLETHYRFRDVAGDGNCLFRALSVGLYGHENEHAKLRAQACDYLNKNQDVLAHNPQRRAILATCDQSGVWGEEPHIVAIARMHKARVVVFSMLEKQWFVSGEPVDTVQPERVVWLRYVDDTHYGGYAYVGAIESVDARLVPQPRAALQWQEPQVWSGGPDRWDDAPATQTITVPRRLKTPDDFLAALREMRAEMEDRYEGLGV